MMDAVDAVDKVGDRYNVQVVHRVPPCRDPAFTWRDREAAR
jgi:hypothetical protein